MVGIIAVLATFAVALVNQVNRSIDSLRREMGVRFDAVDRRLDNLDADVRFLKGEAHQA